MTLVRQRSLEVRTPLRPLPEPIGDLILAELARSQCDERNDQLRIARRQPVAVEDEEGFGDDRRNALVAVDERVVQRAVSACLI